MPWDRTANAGFSTSEPWLPLSGSAAAISVEAQKRDPDSMLSLTRSLLALRRREAALSVGDWKLLPIEGEALAYTRTLQDRSFIVVLDLESRAKKVRLGAGITGRIELSTHAGRAGAPVTDTIELSADEAAVIASTRRLPG
jgi:alpha-glucosidase